MIEISDGLARDLLCQLIGDCGRKVPEVGRFLIFHRFSGFTQQKNTRQGGRVFFKKIWLAGKRI